MTDHGTQHGEENSNVPSQLMQRLLRRATEPLGVIDTRRVQQMVARGPELLAQRFGLAQRIGARYGFAERSPSPIATPLVRSATAKPADDIWAGLRTVSADRLATQSQVHSVEGGTSAARLAAAETGTQGPAGTAPYQTTALQRKSHDVMSSPSSPGLGGASLPVVGEIRAYADSPDATEPRREYISEIYSQPSTQQPGPVGSDGSPLASSLPLVDVRVSRLVDMNEPRTRSTTPPSSITANKTTAGDRRALDGDQIATPNQIEETRPVSVGVGVATSVSMPISANETPARPQPAVVVRESPMPPPPLDAPLILRRSAENQLPAAGSQFHPSSPHPFDPSRVEVPQIMRAIDSTGESHAPSTHPPSSKNSVNVGEIAEEVSRLLTRRYQVARERQGKLK